MKWSQIIGFIGGLLSGAIVGGAIVMLLAPQSGIQTRQSISDTLHEILHAGKQAMADKRQQLRGQYESVIRIPLPATKPERD